MSESVLKKVFSKHAANDIELAAEAGKHISDLEFFGTFFKENQKLIPKYLDKLPNVFGSLPLEKLATQNPSAFGKYVAPEQSELILKLVEASGGEWLTEQQISGNLELFWDNFVSGKLKNLYLTVIDRMLKALEGTPKEEASLKALIEADFFKKDGLGSGSLEEDILKRYLQFSPKESLADLLLALVKRNGIEYGSSFSVAVSHADLKHFSPELLAEVRSPLLDELYNASSEKRAIKIVELYKIDQDKSKFVAALQSVISDAEDSAILLPYIEGMETEDFTKLAAYFSLEAYSEYLPKYIEKHGLGPVKKILENAKYCLLSYLIFGLTKEQLSELDLDPEKTKMSQLDGSAVHLLLDDYLDSDKDSRLEKLVKAAFPNESTKKEFLQSLEYDGPAFRPGYLDALDLTEEEALKLYPALEKGGQFLIENHPELIAELGDLEARELSRYLYRNVANTGEVSKANTALIARMGIDEYISVNANTNVLKVIKALSGKVDIDLKPETWKKVSAKLAVNTPLDQVAIILNELGPDASLFEACPDVNVALMARLISHPKDTAIHPIKVEDFEIFRHLGNETLQQLLQASSLNPRTLAISELLRRDAKEVDRDVIEEYLEGAIKIGETNWGTVTKNTVITLLNHATKVGMRISGLLMEKLSSLLPRYKKPINKNEKTDQDVLADERLSLLRLLLPLAR